MTLHSYEPHQAVPQATERHVLAICPPYALSHVRGRYAIFTFQVMDLCRCFEIVYLLKIIDIETVPVCHLLLHFTPISSQGVPRLSLGFIPNDAMYGNFNVWLRISQSHVSQGSTFAGVVEDS